MKLYDGILIYMKSWMYMSPYDSISKHMKVYECKWEYMNVYESV